MLRVYETETGERTAVFKVPSRTDFQLAIRIVPKQKKKPTDDSRSRQPNERFNDDGNGERFVRCWTNATYNEAQWSQVAQRANGSV